jgi:hypothetical protein
MQLSEEFNVAVVITNQVWHAWQQIISLSWLGLLCSI